jgi:hypothetical protein
MLALAAERAIERVLGVAAAVADLAHLVQVLSLPPGRWSGFGAHMQSNDGRRQRHSLAAATSSVQLTFQKSLQRVAAPLNNAKPSKLNAALT